MDRAYLGHGQGNDGSILDAVEGHLPSTHENILKAVHQGVAVGIQGTNGVICHQLEVL